MRCELCQREVEDYNRHHLIPHTRSNKRVKRDYSREERTKTILVCHPCHDNVHALFSEKELERNFNTLEKLRVETRIQKYLDWIRTKPVDFKPKVRKNVRS